MASTHPLLYVHHISQAGFFRFWRNCLLIDLRLLAALEVAAEMLKKGDFLLEVLRILIESVLVAKVLTVNCAALNVIEVVVVGVKHDFSRVVEEYTSSIVAEVVTETILG